MGKRLSDNLSSLYIGAANRLKPKKARNRIVAYVESYDDVSFWRSVFADFEDENFFFEVMLPSNKSLCKGKKSVLMNKLGSRLGQNMVACVDSDYDYLLQGTTSTSRQINDSRYVFQTYAYAIENYQCYAESLHDACVMATLNDHALVDLEGFMTMYSQIAYPLFIWSVWFYRKNNLREFSMTEFNAYIRLDHVSVRQPEEALMAMDKRVKKKLHELEKMYPGADPHRRHDRSWWRWRSASPGPMCRAVRPPRARLPCTRRNAIAAAAAIDEIVTITVLNPPRLFSAFTFLRKAFLLPSGTG